MERRGLVPPAGQVPGDRTYMGPSRFGSRILELHTKRHVTAPEADAAFRLKLELEAAQVHTYSTGSAMAAALICPPATRQAQLKSVSEDKDNMENKMDDAFMLMDEEFETLNEIIKVHAR